MQGLRKLLNDHCKQTLPVVVAIVALLAGCGGSSQPDPDAPRGQAAFGRYCAGCHGADGQGRAPAFPPLAGSEWLALSPEALTAIVVLGLRGEIDVAGQSYVGYMPPMQHLDDATVADVVVYIRQRWGEPVPAWSAEDVAGLRARLAGERAIEGRDGLDQLLEALP